MAQNKNQYKWQKEKRGKSYIPPTLSAHDEFVPDTHIGIYSLLTNPKDPAIYMSEAQCQKLRQETFDGVVALYKKYGSPDFQIFWNYNLEVINEIGLNKFGKHTKLVPILGIIECFEEKMALKSNGKLRYVISFGVSKARLGDYLLAAKVSRQTGQPIELPKLELNAIKTRDLILFGEARINTDYGDRIRVDKNAVYQQFKHWCRLNGVTLKTGATLALKYFVDNHPIEGLGDTEDYDILTEFDQPIYARVRADTLDQIVKVKMDGNVYNHAHNIIRRYNRDIANIAKDTLTFDGYVNNAIYSFNQRMPLQYSNPDLYEQKRQLELLEQQTGIKRKDQEDEEEYDLGFDAEEEWEDDE